MADDEHPDELGALTNEVCKLRELLERLRLQQYIQALLNTRRIALISLMSGVLSGLGAVLGATLVLTLIVWILSRLEVVPYVGEFVAKIVRIVREKAP